MRIAFDINDVLRNTFFKSEQLYRKYYLSDETDDSLSKSKYDDKKEEWVKVEELQDEFKYELDLPIKSLNLIDHFKFPTNQDLFDFFYVDFAMEIFGNSPTTSNDSFKVLNNFYKEYRDNHEILIISDEIEKSKPASLFFLAKNGCLVEKIKFFSTVTINSLWEECDIIITANPEIIKNAPDGFTILKYITSYNKDIMCEHNISDITELFDMIKKIIK